MAKQTIKGQQKAIREENKIICNIQTYYKGRSMPEYEKMYIDNLQKKILERQAWIENMNGEV
jgi:cell fate (sporulation/competence/biofilm development) regulator YmcA (YheA/YmcA/DUF963 family)